MLRQSLLLLIFMNLNLIATIPEISSSDARKIGQLICKNETGMRKELLTFWNEHESHPSLGIGHNIWFPEQVKSKSTEQFPELCRYFKRHRVALPDWLDQAEEGQAPWANREEFQNDTERVTNLRELLASTVELQTQFMIERLEQRWPLILAQVPEEYQLRVTENFNLLASSPLGLYAMIDYLNFKGDGLNPQEERNGYRWGLAQVLSDMPNSLTPVTVNRAFAISAVKILVRLIENAGADYDRIRFLKGWVNRVSTYYDSKLFEDEE